MSGGLSAESKRKFPNKKAGVPVPPGGFTIANQKQAWYNMDKKTKVTATVQKIDFGRSHKEQIENRYPQWLKTLVCSAWRKLFE